MRTYLAFSLVFGLTTAAGMASPLWIEHQARAYTASQPPPDEATLRAAAAVRPAVTPPPEPATVHAGVYARTCSPCHQAQGQGIPNAFPPLAASDVLMADKERSIDIVLNGLQGKITVKGQPYTSLMPPLAMLTDEEIADALTHARTSFGNKGDAVTAAEVAKRRALGPIVVTLK